MVARALLTLIAVAASAAASAAAPRLCSASAADDQAVAAAVRAFYEAERQGNSAGWRALTAPDFTLFHEGVITTPAVFAAWIDRQHAGLRKDTLATWTIAIDKLRVEVDCNTALTTQVLHSVVVAPTLKPGRRFDSSYLEAFWLRKVPKLGWRIAFWSSTKVPDELPAWAKGK